jgi:hypothetical protein
MVTTYWAATTLSTNAFVHVVGERIILQGPLVLENNAILILENSVLSLDMTNGPDSVTVVTSGTANFTAINTVIDQSLNYCSISNWGFRGTSSITMKNVLRKCNWYTLDEAPSFSSEGSNTGVTLLQGFTGSVSAVDEKDLWLELFLPSGTFTVDQVPQKGDIISSDAGGFIDSLVSGGAWSGAAINIQNCEVREVDIGVMKDVYLTVTNTVELSLSWSIGLYSGDAGFGSLITIQNMNERFVADETWTFGPSSVRLVNTGFKMLWGAYWGYTQVKFENCNYNDVNTMDFVQLSLVDSTLGSLIVSEDASVYLENIEKMWSSLSIKVQDDGVLTIKDCPEISSDDIAILPSGQVVYV